MNNGQDVLERDSISTRTVSEERQKIVTKYTRSSFAIIGSIIGLLFAAAGILIMTGVLSFGNIDEKYGIIVIILGAAMFCFFGMNIRQKEFVTETYTVDRQIPIGPDPYALKLREREEVIDGKINAMSAVFEKLAFLTSELEEKVIAQEKQKLEVHYEEKKNDDLAQAAANAVIAAMREERRQAEKDKLDEEYARKNAELEKKADELRQSAQVLSRKENELAELSESRIREYEEKQKKDAEEMARQTAELKKAMDELAEKERKQSEEARKIDEEKRLIEESKKALKEAEEARLAEEARRAEEARLAEEARIAEEKRLEEEARQAEEARKQAEKARLAEEARKAAEKEEERKRVYQDKLDNLGLSAVSFAWSSENRPEDK